jgi:predicted small integral membrane protein
MNGKIAGEAAIPDFITYTFLKPGEENCMAIRIIKTALIVFVSLLCLLYGIQNIVNLDSAYMFVSTALGMEGHAAYPDSLGPGITSPFLIWISLAIIIFLELVAGLLAGKGAWDMWSARSATADEFNAAKNFAILGGGMALIIWFGLFSAIGGAYFQMWQTELGGASLAGAFQFAALIGIVVIFVNTPDS